MDESNPFLSLHTAPVLIGMIYTLAIWSFGNLNIGLNTAKDFPGRIIAASVIGRDAFTNKSTAWIGTLVNIPALMLAAVFYEVVFKDSQKLIDMGLARQQDSDLQPIGNPPVAEHFETV